MVISKQKVCQRYIYKLNSSRLRNAKWNLTLPLSEARRNDEIISLSDSQILRWIDELNGVTDADDQARKIKSEIKSLRKSEPTIQNRRAIKRLYAELDNIQFKPDYMCMIIDKIKDYHRACKGFSINGIRYVRLVGTNGGIKNSTIVFVSERLSGELRRRIDNGRDTSAKLVPAKLEAYRALTCSASTPVSMPRGILVVNDCEVEFLSDIVYLSDEGVEEPLMELRKSQKIDMDASDGFGLMLPSLAERWGEELGLDYLMSGCNTRFSWEKGMVFTFDFLDFAENVAHNYIVKDAWGNDVDIRGIELVLTVSMVKLWDSYENCESYLRHSIKNGYTFGVAKTCPKALESERNLNYQFIQSYDLTDEEIDELIAPTMNEINSVLHGDWRAALLYLKGVGLTERNVERSEDDISKAIMANPKMFNDPFVKSSIYSLIRNRINEAKVGVVKVHGNYSIVSGDPYALCQSFFGLKVTGLLKAGEVYNKYWSDCGSEKLVCFRAPMSTHSNVRVVRPVKNNDIDRWYKYMNTCTVFNAWDTASAALNGMDYDGDLTMLTDNRVLVSKHVELPALMCAQRRANQIVPSEDDLIKSNIDSFGNEIGQTTNWVTSMFEVRAQFEKGSKEYKDLTYRIQCGQLFQQNAIDKSKGIVCKPMPHYWHDRRSINKQFNDSRLREYQRSIVADKKPYFMRYIYPDLMKRYNNYIKNTNRSSLMEFNKTINGLRETPSNKLTDRAKEFLRYYDYHMPVGVSDCVMNRICRKFEEAFDGWISKYNESSSFDYSIMKSDVEYSKAQRDAVRRLYDEYNKQLKSYVVYANCERVDECEYRERADMMTDRFRQDCDSVCQNDEVLCNIVLDICYTRSSTKRFAWSMCGDAIIRNLLKKNGNVLTFPTQDPHGDIEYCGVRFSLDQKKLEVDL